MVQLIIGVKGEGKTKKMLDYVHEAVKTAEGNLVYLDKSAQNIHIRFRIRISLLVFSAASVLRIMIWKRCTWTDF